MPDKGYVEEAHPLLYFFLNILGFNFCLRDGTDRYKNNYCGYFVVVINSGILLYQIVFEFTYLLSEGTDASVYQMKLSTCCHITSCIYLMSCSYDSLRNRTIIIKYLNAIGPQYKKTFNSIQRSNEYTLLSMYAITIILAYSLVANVASILIMLLTWAPFVNFVPSVLDYQYYTLAEHLIHSYRSISRDIRQVIQTNNAALKGLAPSVVKHYNAESSDISKLRQRGPNTRDGNHSIHCVLFDSRLNDVTSQHVLSRVRKIMKLAALFTKVISSICFTNFVLSLKLSIIVYLCVIHLLFSNVLHLFHRCISCVRFFAVQFFLSSLLCCFSCYHIQ